MINACQDSGKLARELSLYRGSDTARSAFELALTLTAFVALWGAMWLGLSNGNWPVMILAIPAAGFLVRLFMIQHDCGHGALFKRKRSNDWWGRVLGVLTLTPYDYWKRTHAAHHATSGNLDRRGIGDITLLTADEYARRTAPRRLAYRLYRNPIVMFGLGPAYLFFLQHRLPIGKFSVPAAWLSTMATNGAIAAVVVGMVWLVGLADFLIIHVPIVLLAASIGVWLFYVQHQFENTNWARNDDWNVHNHALHGSSHYQLPPVLRWFTANIGMHHIHHLCVKIPFYRLPLVIRDRPDLGEIGKLTMWDSLRCVPLALWDEANQRLISFSEFEDETE